MVRSSPPRPTEAELEILTVLWERGPSTVRTVHAALEPTSGRGYTTVLKLMQIMAEKGLLERDETERSHVYHPTLERLTTQRNLVRDLVDRAFAGSTSALVLRALGGKAPTVEELAEIRDLLDRLEHKRRRGSRDPQTKKKGTEP